MNNKGFDAKIIAFASGKGGVGKTNISVNLSIAFADITKTVPLIMDADLGMANVNIILGLAMKCGLHDLFLKKKKIEDILIKTEYGIQFIPGLSAFYQKMVDFSQADQEYLINELAKLEDLKTIFIDLGAGLLKETMHLVLSADALILVITSEPTSITDAYSLIKTIVEHNKKFKIKFILNRIKNLEEANRISARLIKVSKDFLNIKLEYLGAVFEDENVKKAVINQKPFYRLYPKTKASQCIHQIAMNLLDPIAINSLEKRNNVFDFFKQFIRK